MSKKTIIYIFTVVGLTLGSFVPLLWGGSLLDGWSVLCSTIGGFFGVWLGAKVSKQFS